MNQRYLNAMHRMQSAIALETTRDLDLKPGDDEKLNRILKHMRVSDHSQHSSMGGLSRLLIAKGLISQEEYVNAVTVDMEREADATVERVKKKLGLPDSVRFQ